MKPSSFISRLIKTPLLIRLVSFFIFIILIAEYNSDRLHTTTHFLEVANRKLEEQFREDWSGPTDDQQYQDSLFNYKAKYMSALDPSGSHLGYGFGFLEKGEDKHAHPVDTADNDYFFVDGFLPDTYTWFEFRGNQSYLTDHGNTVKTDWRFAISRNGETRLMIPVRGRFWSVMTPVIKTVYFIAVIFFFLCILAYPFWVITEIAAGNPFHRDNAYRLKWTGIALLIVVVIPVIAGLIMDYFVGKNHPGCFHYPWLEQLFRKKFMLTSGIICLLLASVFKRGERMQQEQELTV